MADDNPEALFEGQKKKKSKKSKPVAEEEIREDPPPAEDDELAVFSEKKKKKKKKSTVDDVPIDGEVDGSEAQAPSAVEERTEAQLEEDESAAMFEGKKKKKKKKAAVEDDGENVVEPVVEQPENVEDMDPTTMFGEKKKKKKKPKVEDLPEPVPEQDVEDGAVPDVDGDAVDGEDEQEAGENDDQGDEEPAGEISLTGEPVAGNEEGWLGSERDYEYGELLSRMYRILRENNPELIGEKRRYTIPPPQVAREGSKKTVFSNVSDIARRMKRTPEHLIQFVFAELGTSGSVDGSGQLIIKGRFQPKQIETVLKRYIGEYVTCKTCKSFETNISRDNRLWFITCESCGSRRTVAAISAGFKAQTTKRAKMRAAA